jgi:hypothetical protein
MREKAVTYVGWLAMLRSPGKLWTQRSAALGSSAVRQGTYRPKVQNILCAALGVKVVSRGLEADCDPSCVRLSAAALTLLSACMTTGSRGRTGGGEGVMMVR